MPQVLELRIVDDFPVTEDLQCPAKGQCPGAAQTDTPAGRKVFLVAGTHAFLGNPSRSGSSWNIGASDRAPKTGSTNSGAGFWYARERSSSNISLSSAP